MSSDNEGLTVANPTLSDVGRALLSIGRQTCVGDVIGSLLAGVRSVTGALHACALTREEHHWASTCCIPALQEGREVRIATDAMSNAQAFARSRIGSIDLSADKVHTNESFSASSATLILPTGAMISGLAIALCPVLELTGPQIDLIDVLVLHADLKLSELASQQEAREQAKARAAADAGLQASNHALAEAQRISQTGSWSWNAQTNAVSGSAEFLRIYEMSCGDNLCYESMARRVHHDDYPAFEQALMQAAVRREVFKHQYRIVRSGGAIRHLNAEGHPSLDESGDLVFTGVVSDVTEQRQAAEALQAAQMQLARSLRFATMGQLAASIVHEINQPLTAVVTNSETCLRWLSKASPDIEQAQLAAARTTRDAERAAKVLIGLRSLAWKSGFAKAAVDINGAIKEVALMLRPEIERERVGLRLFLGATCAVQGDRVQLQQVLLNLMRNSIEAMSATDGPRRLCVSTKGIANRVRIEVYDSGPGFGPEIADNIFDPMYTTKRDGMGMGLSICKSIVEAHEGKLIFSCFEGQGTTFAFPVPCFDPAVPDSLER
jgi:PAS domain S-box-containing protein